MQTFNHNNSSANQMDGQPFPTPCTINPDEGFGAGVGSVFANLDGVADYSHFPVHQSLDINRSNIHGQATVHSFAPDRSVAQLSFTSPNASHWVGSPSHPIQNLGQEDIQYLEDAAGSALHRGFGSQFLPGTYVSLVHDGWPSTSFNLPANAGLQQIVDGSTRSNGGISLNPPLDFSPSPLDWNLALGPGSATDVANYPEVDGSPSLGMGYSNEFNTTESQANPGMLAISAPTLPSQGTGPALQPQSANAPAAATAQNRIPCSVPGCLVSFNRDSDRIRHEAAVHGLNQGFQLYVCPVLTCSKSQGLGYTRKDKLTEHMWKKHGDLGFVKRAV